MRSAVLERRREVDEREEHDNADNRKGDVPPGWRGGYVGACVDRQRARECQFPCAAYQCRDVDRSRLLSRLGGRPGDLQVVACRREAIAWLLPGTGCITRLFARRHLQPIGCPWPNRRRDPADRGETTASAPRLVGVPEIPCLPGRPGIPACSCPPPFLPRV